MNKVFQIFLEKASIWSLLVLVTFVFFLACSKDKVEFETTPYNLEEPSHFPKMKIPLDNPMTVEGVNLGRSLFYETKLSLDNSVSCASCHDQQYAFSDPKQFSEGVDKTLGNRNSMSLANIGFQSFFFWDGRAKTLEDQILEPIPNPVEMHQSWDAAIEKLSKEIYYKNEFFRIFKATKIDKFMVAKVIAQFLRTMISSQSKFDVIYKMENSLPLNSFETNLQAQITNEEIAGYDIFKSLSGGDCFHCHNGALMQVEKFSNNGLDAFPPDFGRELVTGSIDDRGKFKVPTLRNIALTAPYMHDGRFQTLDEVIEHYSTGVHYSPSIDPLMEFQSQGGVDLNAQEKDLLKKFLLTLTDYQFVSNPKFSKP